MNCPHLDGQLESHIIPTSGGTTFTYFSCPTCSGKWLTTFDANYIKGTDIADQQASGREPLKAPRRCPVCQKFLQRALGENIPEDVVAFRCPTGHGYFFPKGELLKFKAAQEANITYHKLWHLPLSSVGATLLTGLVGIIVSVGLVLGVLQSQKPQVTTSQAGNLITKQQAFVVPQTQSVTVVVTTTTQVKVTITINGPAHYQQLMTQTNNLSYVATFLNIPKGIYSYFFTLDQNGQQLTSQTYSFRIP